MSLNESKEIRGFLLLMCMVQYPGGCSDKLMALTLADNQLESSPAVIKFNLEYLEEKGYVRLEEKNDVRLSIARMMAYITAKGIDLLERNIPSDPGIIIIERAI